jgi:enoyl-CoA hydratase/3-hydroxyacyl-CoA dehydrogenase
MGGKYMTIKKIAVLGAGTMGAGIAQRCAQSGFEVVMMDIKDEFVENGFKNITKTLEKGIERGKVTEEQKTKILDNIKGTTSIEEAGQDVDLVIEAVFEDMEVKKNLFTDLTKTCPDHTIFASNTSSLSITELGKATGRPDKFAGLHFFNPAAINRLIEVIAGEDTSDETMNILLDLSTILGKIPLNVKDAPGFAVNRYFVPFLNEACIILEKGVANIPTIDKAAMSGFMIGMGPFKLMNFTGIPIAYHSEESLSKGLGDLYKTSEALKKQFEAGDQWDLEGEVDPEKLEEVKSRLFGCTWGIACQLVDEGVASKEDVDRGATIGLRWAAGPFAMMNAVGIEQAYKIIENYANSTNGKFEVPGNLKKQAESGKPWEIKYVSMVKDNEFAVITMNRPEALNALNSKVLSDLQDALDKINDDPEIKSVIITGAGNAFVAGADIKEMISKTPDEARVYTKFGHDVFNKIEQLPKPVIAAVNGYALGGGCELALSCDIIIASKKARLGLPEVGLGIHPGFGGTQRLPRLVGKAKAKELIFTTDIITSDEAERIGLVNKVVAPESLMAEAKKVAGKIARQGPVAIKLAKSVINRGLDVDLKTALGMELDSVTEAFTTEDKTEGMKAFIEKRKPEFKGK